MGRSHCGAKPKGSIEPADRRTEFAAYGTAAVEVWLRVHAVKPPVYFRGQALDLIGGGVDIPRGKELVGPLAPIKIKHIADTSENTQLLKLTNSLPRNA
jgi:hypothetical protein